MKWYHEPPGPLQEIQVGKWMTVNGERRRVTSVETYEATEDDSELGIHAGDMVTTMTLEVIESAVGSAVEGPGSGGDERIRTAE